MNGALDLCWSHLAAGCLCLCPSLSLSQSETKFHYISSFGDSCRKHLLRERGRGVMKCVPRRFCGHLKLSPAGNTPEMCNCPMKQERQRSSVQAPLWWGVTLGIGSPAFPDIGAWVCLGVVCERGRRPLEWARAKGKALTSANPADLPQQTWTSHCNHLHFPINSWIAVILSSRFVLPELEAWYPQEITYTRRKELNTSNSQVADEGISYFVSTDPVWFVNIIRNTVREPTFQSTLVKL